VQPQGWLGANPIGASVRTASAKVAPKCTVEPYLDAGVLPQATSTADPAPTAVPVVTAVPSVAPSSKPVATAAGTSPLDVIFEKRKESGNQ